MEALRTISAEHQSLASVLHAMRFMLKEVEAGRLQPDLDLFEAMVHYLDAYAEQRHHPKEDVLFHYFRERHAEGGEALQQLDEQHQAAHARITVLHRALADLQADASRFTDFARAFNAYADFYRSHMVLEEDVVLPLVRRHLTPEDWAVVDAAFAEAARAIGPAQEDFSALYTRLVDCAPAPIGFGPRPFKPD